LPELALIALSSTLSLGATAAAASVSPKSIPNGETEVKTGAIPVEGVAFWKANEKTGEGEGEGEGADICHSADQDCNNIISLSELLRVVQF